MHTELVVPLEENENYADSLTADYDGLDLHIDGETYSASFEDVDRAELALAIIDDTTTGVHKHPRFLPCLEKAINERFDYVPSTFPGGTSRWYEILAVGALALAVKYRAEEQA